MDLKDAKVRVYDCMVQIEFWKGELAKANQLVNKIFAEQEQAEVKKELDKKIDVADKKTK